MANPVPVSYSSPVAKVGGGCARFPNALLNRIAAAPPASWLKLNKNLFESIFEPAPFGHGSAQKILSAWSSVAWDYKRHRAYPWGGGHANTSNTEIYMFDATTGLWSLAYHGTASALVVVEGETNTTRYDTADGAFGSPVSCHTYDNNNYLPGLDCCIFMGGAAWNTGANPVVRIPTGSDPALRTMGAYRLDIPLMGKGFVSGNRGANVYSGGGDRVDLPGARAWNLRDWRRGDLSFVDMGSPANGSIAGIRIEDGIDVAYCCYGRNLYRVEFHQDWRDDVIEKWGSFAVGASGLKTAAFDFSRNLVVVNSSNNADKAFTFWDTDTPGASNYDRAVPPGNLIGPGAAQYLNEHHYQSAIKWNPDTGKIMSWCEGTNTAQQPTRENAPGRVYSITPPTGTKPTPTTGWFVELECDGAGESPVSWQTTEADRAGGTSGLTGKWRWAEDLRGFIGIQNKWRGDVFFYKPAGWIDPRG